MITTDDIGKQAVIHRPGEPFEYGYRISAVSALGTVSVLANDHRKLPMTAKVHPKFISVCE